MAAGHVPFAVISSTFATEVGTVGLEISRLGGLTMDDKFWEKYGALGGIWFVILAVVGSLLAGAPPRRDGSVADIVKWYADNDSAIQLGGFLGGLGVIGLLWWFGSLWRAMGRADTSSNRVGVIALAGLGFGGAMAFAGFSVNSATASRIDDIGDGADFFYSLSSVFFGFSAIGIAVLVMAVSGLAWRTGFLPRWLAQAGFVVVLAEIVASVGVANDAAFFGLFGFIAFLAWALWIAVISWLLYQQTPADQEASAEM